MEILDYNLSGVTIKGDRMCGYTEGMNYLHKHTHYEISVVVRGSLEIINNNDILTTDGSCVVLHFPGSVHCVKSDPSVCYERYNINFNAEVFRNNSALVADVEQLFVSNVSVLYPEEDRLRELIYYLEPLTHITEEDVEKRERLLAVILSILKKCPFADTSLKKRSSSGCVNRAIVRLAEKTSALVTASELADEIKVSRAKLTADFKRETGMTLKDYTELQCVERAKGLLAQGSTVKNTADSLGFVDVGTFIRVFKKVAGVTPGKFAKGLGTGA